MAKRRKSKSLKVVDLIKKFAGEKGKKAAEKKFGKPAVEAAQATVSKRKPVTTGKKEKTSTLEEGFQKTDPEYYQKRRLTTPELTGKKLKMSSEDQLYDPAELYDDIAFDESFSNRKAGGKVKRKAGGKVMTGSPRVASLYD